MLPGDATSTSSVSSYGRLFSWPFLLVIGSVIGLFVAGALAPDWEHGVSLALLSTSGVLVTPAFITTEVWERLLQVAESHTRAVARPRVLSLKGLIENQGLRVGWFVIGAGLVCVVGLAIAYKSLPSHPHRLTFTTGVTVGLALCGAALGILVLALVWSLLGMLYWKVASPSAPRTPLVRAVDVVGTLKDRPATLAFAAVLFGLGTFFDLLSTYLRG